MGNSQSEDCIRVRYADQTFSIKITLGKPMKTILDSLHTICSMPSSTQLFFRSVWIDPSETISNSHFGADFDAGEVRDFSAKSQFGFSIGMKVSSKAQIKDVKRMMANRLGLKTTDLELAREDSGFGDEETIERFENDSFFLSFYPENPTIFIIQGKVLKWTLTKSSNSSAETIRRYISSEGNLPIDKLVLVSNGKVVQNQLPPLVKNALFVYYIVTNPDIIHLLVKCVDGRCITLDADAKMTIFRIKEKLAVSTSRSIASIGLIYNGKVVSDASTLLSLNIRNSSVLWSYPPSNLQKVLVRGEFGIKTLDLSPNDSIATVKTLLQTLTKIHISQQAIKFGYMPLEDSETIPTPCFQNWAVLNCQYLPAFYIRALSGKLTKIVAMPGCSIGDIKSTLVMNGVLPSLSISFTYGIQHLRNEALLSDLGLIDRSIIDGDFL